MSRGPLPTQTERIILKNKPRGEVILGNGDDATFRLETVDLPRLRAGQALVEAVYLSNDPAQKLWMNAGADPDRLYHPPMQEGEAIAGTGTLSRVLDVAGQSGLGVGDYVIARPSIWTRYQVIDQAAARKVEKLEGAPMSVYLGSLGGLTSLTAYSGLFKVLQIREGETIVISGAAGAVGNLVVQLAKKVAKAKRVIGLAGSDDKCQWLRSIGADVALNYKASDFQQQLTDATKSHIDCYFDNIGGDMLTYVLPRMKVHGRIACCGSISNYSSTDSSHRDVGNWFEVINLKLRIQGFIVSEFAAYFGEMREALVDAFKAGKLSIEGGETIVDARGHFERVPEIWTQLFKGANTGKLLTQVGDL